MITQRLEVMDFIKKTFHVDAEYLWEKYPNYAVFRHQDNRKWFAVICDVNKSALGLSGEEKIDVVTVKCDPLLASSLTTMAGYHKAYHMNKTHWVSVQLDSVVKIEEIENLIMLAYNMTKNKGKK